MMEDIKDFLVLGAGASRGARVGTGYPLPPVGSELADYLVRWVDDNNYVLKMENPIQRTIAGFPHVLEHPAEDLFEPAKLEKARAFLREARTAGFEATVQNYVERDAVLDAQANIDIAAAMNDPSRAAEAFRRRESKRSQPTLVHMSKILAFSMLNGQGLAFPEAVDGYDRLFSLQRFRQRTAVVTTNYDLLTEEALQRLGRFTFVYPPDTLPGIRFPIYKVHGSVNWIPVFPNTASATLEVSEALANKYPISTSGPHSAFETKINDTSNDRRNAIMKLKDFLCRAPLVASYGPGKPIFDNYNYVEQTHRLALDAFQRNPNASVTFIGITLTSDVDDPRLSEIVAEAKKLTGDKKYIDPSPEACAMAATHGFLPHEMGLFEFIAAVERDEM